MGANWEAVLTRQDLYEGQGVNTRFVPLVFDPDEPPGAEAFVPKLVIPKPLRPHTHYRLPRDYAKLLRYLTDQPSVIFAPLGKEVVLPPDPPNSIEPDSGGTPHDDPIQAAERLLTEAQRAA